MRLTWQLVGFVIPPSSAHLRHDLGLENQVQAHALGLEGNDQAHALDLGVYDFDSKKANPAHGSGFKK